MTVIKYPERQAARQQNHGLARVLNKNTNNQTTFYETIQTDNWLASAALVVGRGGAGLHVWGRQGRRLPFDGPGRQSGALLSLRGTAWRPTASNAATTGSALDGTYVYNTTAPIVPELGLPGIDTNSIDFLGNSTDSGSVDIPFNPVLSPVASDGLHGAPFSVECWAQSYTAVNSAYLSMLGMHGPYGAAPYGNASGFLLGQTPPPNSTTPPQWLFVLRNGAFLNTGAVTPLQWTHLVGVFDGTNGYLYINGALATSAAACGYLADPSADGSVGIVPNAGIVPSGPYAA